MEIQINKYKSFEDTKFKLNLKNNNINFILGENNSGKSNLIEFINELFDYENNLFSLILNNIQKINLLNDDILEENQEQNQEKVNKIFSISIYKSDIQDILELDFIKQYDKDFLIFKIDILGNCLKFYKKDNLIIDKDDYIYYNSLFNILVFSKCFIEKFINNFFENKDIKDIILSFRNEYGLNLNKFKDSIKEEINKKLIQIKNDKTTLLEFIKIINSIKFKDNDFFFGYERYYGEFLSIIKSEILEKLKIIIIKLLEKLSLIKSFSFKQYFEKYKNFLNSKKMQIDFILQNKDFTNDFWKNVFNIEIDELEKLSYQDNKSAEFENLKKRINDNIEITCDFVFFKLILQINDNKELKFLINEKISEQKNLKTEINKNEHYSDFSNLSTGTLGLHKILKTLLILKNLVKNEEKNKYLFLLDEPTNSLSNSSVTFFKKTIENIVNKNNNFYFFIISHRTSIMDENTFQNLYFLQKKYDVKKKKIVTEIQNNVINFRGVGEKQDSKEKEIKWWLYPIFIKLGINKEFTMKFLDNKIIFVEGYHDMLLFNLFKKLDKKYKKLTFIPLNGASKKPLKIDLLSSLNGKIPTFIFDNDKAGRIGKEQILKHFEERIEVNLIEENIFFLERNNSTSDFEIFDLFVNEIFDEKEINKKNLKNDFSLFHKYLKYLQENFETLSKETKENFRINLEKLIK